MADFGHVSDHIGLSHTLLLTLRDKHNNEIQQALNFEHDSMASPAVLGLALIIVVFLLAVVLLSCLSPAMSAAGFYARIMLSMACLVACAIYGVFASIALRLVGYGGLSQWTVARSFKWTMRLTTGIQFVLQDEQHLKTRPAVFIGNHQTSVRLVESFINQTPRLMILPTQ